MDAYLLRIKEVIIIDNREIRRLSLHTLVSDGMVLQRNANVKVWGWSEPNEEISVRFLNHSYRTTADSTGRWSVTLMKLEAGGPYEMEIEGRDKIVLHDILIGDVWICSGQSNMQLPMARVKDKYADFVEKTVNSHIRQFDVPEHYDFHTPCDNTEKSKWQSVSHETILNFTAIGLFFAKQLYEIDPVPIGLIKTAIGGAHIEAWMSRESLRNYPEKIKSADRFSDDQYVKHLMQSEEIKEKQWYEQLDKTDEGLRCDEPKWYEENYDDSDWKTMPIPSYWADEGLGIKNGAFWFRKDVVLPASLAGLPARIFMGRIVDADFIYINGEFVGTTSYRYPPRKYDVPAGLLKEGRNTIAIRVISNRGKGGFITDKPYQLIFNDRTMDLSGEWKYRVGAFAEMLPDKTFLNQIPVGLFNGMLSPISEYTVKGVLWYQGESNTSEPEEYEGLFIEMIKEWRKKLKQDNLPFLYVQLPNYLECENMQAVNKWPLLREAQLKALRVPNTAMAVAIDVGEWNDLHPLNKQDIGKRLAQAARKVAYEDKNAVGMGPIFHHMEVMDNKAILSFTNIGTGLVSKDGEKLRNFEIAGKDGIFYEAEACIENGQVIVSCNKIRVPETVRYAWSDSPQNINFYNREGLPASPFRTKSDHNE
jgi:sialate O-acetylesterase